MELCWKPWLIGSLSSFLYPGSTPPVMLPDISLWFVRGIELSILSAPDPEGFLVLLLLFHLALDAVVACATEKKGQYPLEGVTQRGKQSNWSTSAGPDSDPVLPPPGSGSRSTLLQQWLVISFCKLTGRGVSPPLNVSDSWCCTGSYSMPLPSFPFLRRERMGMSVIPQCWAPMPIPHSPSGYVCYVLTVTDQ